MFNTASEVNGGEYADGMESRHCGMSVKLQLLVGSWDIDLQVKQHTIFYHANDNSRKFTGYAYVSHDNIWTGGFVSVYCVNGSESSLEDCDPVKVITGRMITCKSGNHARLLCEPGTQS